MAIDRLGNTGLGYLRAWRLQLTGTLRGAVRHGRLVSAAGPGGRTPRADRRGARGLAPRAASAAGPRRRCRETRAAASGSGADRPAMQGDQRAVPGIGEALAGRARLLRVRDSGRVVAGGERRL